VSVDFNVETELETDGRWLAEVVELPGVLAYGSTQDEAIAHVQALALGTRPSDARASCQAQRAAS
jgi:predicted RNase H-like HicB family nuclease